jgi:O-antigen ligase
MEPIEPRRLPFTDQQKLPNATISLVLSIISFLCCCVSWGIGGVLLSGIALILINKDTKLYAENPDMYDNFSQVKTAKIIAIIGLVIGALTFVFIIFQIMSAGGWGAYMEQQQEGMKMLEEMFGN